MSFVFRRVFIIIIHVKLMRGDKINVLVFAPLVPQWFCTITAAQPATDKDSFKHNYLCLQEKAVSIV